MPEYTDAQLEEAVNRLLSERLNKMGLLQVGIATVHSSYTSGDVPLVKPGESAAPTILSGAISFYSASNLPAASDKIAYLAFNNGNDLRPIGKFVAFNSLPAVVATSFHGLKWVKIGSGTTFASANTERNTTSINYVTLKRFRVERPGLYRVVVALARDGAATATARLIIEKQAGDIADTEGGAVNSTHPTFTSQNLDQTIRVMPGDIVGVQLKSSSGDTVYIQNVSLKGDDETASITPATTVVTD